MFRVIIALFFVFAAQAQAQVYDRHEIIDVRKPCTAPKVIRNSHGEVKTQSILTYEACQDGRGEVVHTEISLPGDSPVVQETVEMLCKGLRTYLLSKLIDIEMSACMKE